MHWTSFIYNILHVSSACFTSFLFPSPSPLHLFASPSFLVSLYLSFSSSSFSSPRQSSRSFLSLLLHLVCLSCLILPGQLKLSLPIILITAHLHSRFLIAGSHLRFNLVSVSISSLESQFNLNSSPVTSSTSTPNSCAHLPPPAWLSALLFSRPGCKPTLDLLRQSPTLNSSRNP